LKKVIDLDQRRRSQLRSKDPELNNMMRLADDIDAVLQAELNADIIEPRNMVSVLTHRLGYFISVIPMSDEDRDAILNYVVELILKLNMKKAKIKT